MSPLTPPESTLARRFLAPPFAGYWGPWLQIRSTIVSAGGKCNKINYRKKKIGRCKKERKKQNKITRRVKREKKKDRGKQIRVCKNVLKIEYVLGVNMYLMKERAINETKIGSRASGS